MSMGSSTGTGTGSGTTGSDLPSLAKRSRRMARDPSTCRQVLAVSMGSSTGTGTGTTGSDLRAA